MQTYRNKHIPSKTGTFVHPVMSKVTGSRLNNFHNALKINKICV